RTFSGEVVGMVRGGVFVSFAGELGALYEGFLPIARLGEGWFEPNELETALVSRRGAARVRLGDPIEVTVDRIETLRGRVTLGRESAAERPSQRTGGRGTGAGRGRGRRKTPGPTRRR